jgi:hypothetical protein
MELRLKLRPMEKLRADPGHLFWPDHWVSQLAE